MTVHGRIAGSSNATLLVTCALGETELAGRLQAGPGRAAPVGLPDRAPPPRGSGLRPLPGPRVGPRPRHRGPRRGAVRARLGAAPRPRGRRVPLLHAARGPGVAPGAGDHRRLRRGGQQRRPQERPRAVGRGAAVGHRPRAHVPCRAQAAHGHLGLRRRTASRGPGGRPRAAARPMGSPTSSASCSSPTSDVAVENGRPRWWRRAACPSPTTTGTGPPTPGRSFDPGFAPRRATMARLPSPDTPTRGSDRRRTITADARPRTEGSHA